MLLQNENWKFTFTEALHAGRKLGIKGKTRCTGTLKWLSELYEHKSKASSQIKMEAPFPHWASQEAAEAQVLWDSISLFPLTAVTTPPLNNWLQDALQETINHFTCSTHGIQLIPDQMQGGFVDVRFAAKSRARIWHLAVAQWVSLKQKAGRENCCRRCGRFCCAYLEVVIRVSGFIFPGIAGWWWPLRGSCENH